MVHVYMYIVYIYGIESQVNIYPIRTVHYNVIIIILIEAFLFLVQRQDGMVK